MQSFKESAREAGESEEAYCQSERTCLYLLRGRSGEEGHLAITISYISAMKENF